MPQADTLRSLIPRFAGYPEEFDTDDDSYIKGIYLLMFYGFFFAFLGLVVWLLMCLCRKRVNADDPEQKAEQQKKPVCLPYMSLLLVGLFILVFAALGLYWNQELDRGVADDDVGATHLMLQIIDSVITKNVLLTGHLNRINQTAPEVADDVLPELLDSRSRIYAANQSLWSEMDSLEALLSQDLVVSATDSVVDDLSHPCATCSDVGFDTFQGELEMALVAVDTLQDEMDHNFAALTAFDLGVEGRTFFFFFCLSKLNCSFRVCIVWFGTQRKLSKLR